MSFFFSITPPKGKILKVKEWVEFNNKLKEKVKNEEKYWNGKKLLETGMVS